MTAIDEEQPSTWGEAMAAELLWVHGKIRHDLEAILQKACSDDGSQPRSPGL